MRGLVVVLSVIAILAVCGAQTGAYGQTVSITFPDTRALFQQVDGRADIPVHADAWDVPTGGGIQFVLDAGTPDWRTVIDWSPPYETVFTRVGAGEHTLDACVLIRTGLRAGSCAREDRIGVGDIIVAMGDSITAGEEDDIFTDNWSADGRTGAHVDSVSGKEYGGFEPILADMLAAERRYPVMIVNKGVPGALSAAAAANANAIANEYPTARTWILAYGSNDAGKSVSASTVRNNLQTAIQRIRQVIPDAQFYIPKIFYNHKYEATVTEYNNKIGDITRNIPGVRWGADLDTLFRGNHMLYDHAMSQPGTWFAPISSHHPNGIGVQKMAALWEMAISDNVILVTDGVPGAVGQTWADQLRISGTNTVGLSGDNLLQVCPQSPQGPAPPGTSYLCTWAHDLRLTGAYGFSPASMLTATVRVEEDNLPRVGATSWSQVWLASGSVLLPTSRVLNSRNSHNYDLSTSVYQPGQIACVVDVTPPVTTYSLSPSSPAPGHAWYTTPPQVTLSAKDSSGLPVDTIMYRWDSGPMAVYADALTAPKGVHTLYYHAVDRSGNVETDQAATIMVISAPSIPIVSDNARYADPSGSVDVTWRVDDPGTGVAQYQYAVGSYAGATDLQAWTSVGTATGVTWSLRSVPLGTTVYFSVRAFSADWQSSPTGCSDGVLVVGQIVSIPMAKARPDGTPVSIRQVIVAASFGDVTYIEHQDGSAGIGAYGIPNAQVGQIATVTGRLATVNGQRALVDVELRDRMGYSIPRPRYLAMSVLRLDSDALSWRGTSTHGLLVTVRGRVISSGVDGFRMYDGTTGIQKALYVDASRLQSVPANGTAVDITGICAAFSESGVWKPVLAPRNDGDVKVLR